MPTLVTTKKLAYSPAEAAAALGVSRQHIYKMMSDGRIASAKLGRSRRIPVAEIEALLHGGAPSGGA